LTRLSFVLLLVLSFFCGNCLNTSYQSPTTYGHSKKVIVHNIQNASVALVRENSQNMVLPFCAGVWVSEREILTARHCIDDLANPLSFLGIELEATDEALKGKTVKYQTFNDFDHVSFPPATSGSSEIRFAMIIAADDSTDLALLSVVEDVPHSIAAIGPSSEIYDGMDLLILGHKAAHGWSLSPGVLSTTRLYEFDSKHTLLTYQISAPIWPGDSGGGAFDEHGRLIGLVSFIIPKVRDMSFIIHHDRIVDFLHKNLK